MGCVPFRNVSFLWWLMLTALAALLTATWLGSLTLMCLHLSVLCLTSTEQFSCFHSEVSTVIFITIIIFTIMEVDPCVN